jgi:hypothetical protein
VGEEGRGGGVTLAPRVRIQRAQLRRCGRRAQRQPRGP